MSNVGSRSDPGSDSGTEQEDLENHGLVATRAKRVNAGNLYATLRNNLDDADLQRELMEEEEDDAGEYEASDREDDDAAMESSSDEEDAGPPKEGEEDLEGEKVLKRIERQEAKKKRKMKDAGLRLPAWAAKKRVKLADDVKTEDGSPKSKKKSERAHWLPPMSDGPIRQSTRALAMANREIVHAHLQQSFQRSEKQRMVMKDAAVRDRTTKRADLTREERLEKAAKIAKETKREFGKWEREELERQRLRDEMLAAKRLRDIDGPFVRYWSGSGIWNGQKFVVTRNLPQKDREMLSQLVKNEAEESAAKEKPANHKDEDRSIRPEGIKHLNLELAQNSESQTEAENCNQDHLVLGDSSTQADQSARETLSGEDNPTVDLIIAESNDDLSNDTQKIPVIDGGEAITASPESSAPLPAGIDQSAALAPTEVVEQSFQPPPATNVPMSEAKPLAQLPSHTPPVVPPDVTVGASTTVSTSPYQFPTATKYTSWPPGPPQVPSLRAPSPPQPTPVIREQAMRVCIMLEQYDELDIVKKSKLISNLEPTQTAKVLLPDSYTANFTLEESKYLTSKHRKNKNGENIPPAPSKQRCAITSWPAKYRDPKTGLAYFDMQMYKAIQRILAGGSMWSGLLGAWVGPAPGGISIGRPANGVPEGFSAPPSVASSEIKGEADQE